MKISYNWLKEYVVGKLPPPAKLAELLTAHSFEVEAVEKAGKDSILDIAVLPNRAHDCLSHIGVAKELAALLKLKTKNEKRKIKEDNKLKVGDYLSVEIKDLKRCPLYAARVISGIKVGPSPKWLKERLEALGQKSINNVVDATNYVMLELGQPLHAFDLDRIDGGQIIARAARDEEKIRTLGNEEYVLNKKDLVIADAKDALAIAGVKGGVKAEVTMETKNIVLESAYFEPSGVRATSKRIGLRTDASLRFENGTVPTLPEKALDRVADLIADLAGGKIASGAAHSSSADWERTTKGTARVFFVPDDINKLLGVNISEKEIIAILKRLGFSISKANGLPAPVGLSAQAGGYVATPPEYRIDVGCFQDLAEEVGRIYGFENIPSVLPQAVLTPSSRNDELFISDKIKAVLSGVGFFETYNRSFVSERQLDVFSFDKKTVVAMANPMSLEHKYLRPSLLMHLLNNTAENLKYQNKINLFEIGNVFILDKGNKVLEQTILAGTVAVKGRGTLVGDGFYELKGVIDALLEKLGLDDFRYDEYAALTEAGRQLWHIGRTALIKLGDRTIGVAGEINKGILRDLGIAERVMAFEISTRDLIELAEEKTIYIPISKFPAVERDIAVLVPNTAKADEVKRVIAAAGGDLLVDSDLFDIYEGKNLNAGQKSLAFHLIFQSLQRTLTDNEINGILDKVIEAIKDQGWEVRK